MFGIEDSKVEGAEGEVSAVENQDGDVVAGSEAPVDAEAAGDSVGSVDNTIDKDSGAEVVLDLIDTDGDFPEDVSVVVGEDATVEGVVEEVVAEVKAPLTLQMLAAAVRFLAQSQGQIAQESMRHMFPSIFED